MMTEFDTNQTQFSADQPLFQDVTIPEIAVKHEEETEVKPNPKKKFFCYWSGYFWLSLFIAYSLSGYS